MPNSDGTEDPTRQSRWLIGAAIVTAIYGVVLFALFMWGRRCVAGLLCTPIMALSSLDLNELGDLFAGIFAPIAFLWLACAVGVQSEELREQRKELALTRREFELTRAVAEAAKNETAAQAATARETAEFIKQQTAVLVEEGEQRKRDAIDREFLDLLNAMLVVVRVRPPSSNLVKQTIRTPRNIFGVIVAESGIVRL